MGEFYYAPQLDLLQDALRDSIEIQTVFELSESLEASAGSSSSAQYGAILDLRAIGFDAPSESSELSKWILCAGDESELHAGEFLEMARFEVFAYKKMAKRE